MYRTPLLNTSHTRPEFSEKTSSKTKKWPLEMGQKNIQAAAYNGVCTVFGSTLSENRDVNNIKSRKLKLNSSL